MTIIKVPIITIRNLIVLLFLVIISFAVGLLGKLITNKPFVSTAQAQQSCWITPAPPGSGGGSGGCEGSEGGAPGSAGSASCGGGCAGSCESSGSDCGSGGGCECGSCGSF